MADFQTKLVRKEDVAEGTMAFYLEKPKGFTYLPGQHPTVQILNPSETDAEGDSRTFSFITIPSDHEIGFATRTRDTAFKRILRNAELGLSMMVKNPRGSMVLPSDTSRPLVFLAGGIGITPLISMIREATAQKSNQKITLFYVNKTIAQAAFSHQLEELTKENLNFTFIPVMTQEDPNIWHGETGHLTKELIQKYLPTMQNTIFYFSGPTAMVESIVELLKELGVDPLFMKSEDYGEYK